jgi:hypothetical protein
MRRALNKIQRACKDFSSGEIEPVITSTYEGNHSPSSLHYANLAVDIRLPYSYSGTNKKLIERLKRELGKDFDIVLEVDHIHCEYDPKG